MTSKKLFLLIAALLTTIIIIGADRPALQRSDFDELTFREKECGILFALETVNQSNFYAGTSDLRGKINREISSLEKKAFQRAASAYLKDNQLLTEWDNAEIEFGNMYLRKLLAKKMGCNIDSHANHNEALKAYADQEISFFVRNHYGRFPKVFYHQRGTGEATDYDEYVFLQNESRAAGNDLTLLNFRKTFDSEFNHQSEKYAYKITNLEEKIVDLKNRIESKEKKIANLKREKRPNTTRTRITWFGVGLMLSIPMQALIKFLSNSSNGGWLLSHRF